MIALVVIVVVGAVIWGVVAYSRREDDSPPIPSFNLEARSEPTATPQPSPIVSLRRSLSPMVWAGTGSVIRVAGYEVVDPLVYYSDGMPGTPEPSCIDTTLGVDASQENALQPCLGSWPHYDSISEAQRAYYLSWLASGRKVRAKEVGYAFLYYYGLERRALVDNWATGDYSELQAKDLQTVITEVAKLLALHGDSNPFRSYAASFLGYLDAGLRLTGAVPNQADILGGQQTWQVNESALELTLAGIYRSGKPLPEGLAFAVARANVRSSRSVVVERVPQQFRELFGRKYTNRFGNGMVLRAAAHGRPLYYRPANDVLACPPTRTMPDVLGLQGQFKPLADIWNESIEELRAFSRQVGKSSDANSIEAYFALPDALRAVTDHPRKEAWEQFVQQHDSANNTVLVHISDLAPLCEYAATDKLSRSQSDALAATATAVGFVIVPDSRTTGRPYYWDDPVALFRIDGVVPDPADNAYRAVVLMTEIGIAVAAADGTIDQAEAAYIAEFLNRQFSLPAEYTRCTSVYRDLLTSAPPALGEITRRLRAGLPADKREIVGRFMIGVAAANKVVTKKEVAALRRLYTALGIDPAKVDELVTELSSSLDQAVEIQKGSKGAAAEAIPPRIEAVFTLSPEALRRVMDETEQVARLLGDVLDREVAETDVHPETATLSVQRKVERETVSLNPDPPYDKLVAALLTQPEWSKEQFDKLVRENGCMPAAALEAINTWSDEVFGDFLVEEGETYKVNQALPRRT